jgi:hypothetical protein
MEKWHRTGLFEDAVISLKRCEEETQRFRSDPDALKWMVISLHSSVQGFIALVLSQGNGLQLMRKSAMVKWLEAHKNGHNYPDDTRMDTFLNLYSKIKKEECMQGMSGVVPFKSDGHNKAMKYLNELRNQFIHFNIDGWSINTGDLAWVIAKSMDVVEFTYQSPHFPWHRCDDSEILRNHIGQQISNIRSAFCTNDYD